MNDLELYKKERDALLTAAELREFTRTDIEDAFRGDAEAVPGIAYMQTTERLEGSHKVVSSDDLKACLIDHLDGEAARSNTLGPIQFFRFVRNSDLKRRMAPHGLDHLV